MSSPTSPPPESIQQRSRFREPLIWALVVVIAFLTLFGCGQAALDRLGPAARVDTRSNIHATYQPWGIEIFAPVSTAVIADIQQDPRFPTATLNPLVPTLDPGGIWGPTATTSPTPTRPVNTSPSATAGPSATRTATIPRLPTSSPSPSDTPVPPQPSATATRVILPPTRTATATPTPPPSATNTVAPPPPATPTPTITPTPTLTGTPTATGPATSTATATPTLSATPSATATQTLTPTPTETASASPTPTPTPPDCTGNPEPDLGGPDGCYASIAPAAFLIIDLGAGQEITTLLAGPEIIYYERVSNLSPYSGDIAMDDVIVEISPDLAAWTQVFYWGDGLPTNNGHLGGAYPEADNQSIPVSALYGFVPYKTGILIDLDPFVAVIPPGGFRYIRLTEPGTADAAELDSIDVLRP